MKLFTSIILGGVLQVLAVSASRAANVNPDTANALDCFFLESVENPDFPWHLERAHVEIKGHFYTIYQNEFGGLTVQKY